MPRESHENEPANASRRNFFRRGAQAAAAVGAASISPAAIAARGDEGGRREAVAVIRIDAKKVRDIAAGPDDRIHVAADNALFIFHADGSPHARTRFESPVQAVTVREDGTAVIGTRNSVSIIGRKGQFLAIYQFKGTPSIVSLSTHVDGSIFAGDSGNNAIWKLKSDGRLSGKIETGIKTLDDFFPMASDASGNLCVADTHRHRILEFSSTGERTGSWGSKSRNLSGFGGCCNPVAIAAMSAGRVVTAEAGLPRIKVFSANGRFSELIAGPEDFETNARESHETPQKTSACHDGGFELAVDSRDRILVLDRVSREVRIFA